MYKSVTIEESDSRYYVMINGNEVCGLLRYGTIHQSKAQKVASSVRSTRHHIAQVPSGFACQWSNADGTRGTCSKPNVNECAIFPTRKDASAFFVRNGILEDWQ